MKLIKLTGVAAAVALLASCGGGSDDGRGLLVEAPATVTTLSVA